MVIDIYFAIVTHTQHKRRKIAAIILDFTELT